MDWKAEMSEIARKFLMMSTVTITTTYLLTIGGIPVWHKISVSNRGTLSLGRRSWDVSDCKDWDLLGRESWPNSLLSGHWQLTSKKEGGK